MNYEDMSDFEINSAVHNRVKRLGYDLEFLGCDRIKWSKRGADDVFTGKVCYSKNTVTDYCNNWADAGLVIFENNIGISPYDLDPSSPDYVTHKDVWFAQKDMTMLIDDKNPLRAAMIVFLMMKDSEK